MNAIKVQYPLLTVAGELLAGVGSSPHGALRESAAATKTRCAAAPAEATVGFSDCGATMSLTIFGRTAVIQPHIESMSMREEWLAAILAAILLIFNGCSSDESAPARPNILFLLTDDQRADTLGVAGHPIIATPHLDRLANDGVLFTQAHVAEPTCSPSRVTYFTGQYERVHGVGFSSTGRMTESQWNASWPALLRESGYYTGFVGKFGVEYYDFDAAEKFDFWRGHNGWARFFAKTVPNCEIYEDSGEEIITPIMAESVERFLESARPGRPFALQVSFSAPHGSITTSMDVLDGGKIDNRTESMTQPANRMPQIADHPIYGSLYRDLPIQLPLTFTADTGKYLPKEIYDPHANAAQTYGYDFTADRCTEHHYRYYQCVRGIDETVGRIVSALELRGVAENTVIVYSSDHGVLLGDYGMGGKALLYDLVTRVPFIVYDPRLGTELRGRQLDELVLSTDVAPTLLSLAGVAAPSGMQGRDLTPLLNGSASEWREEILTENLFIGRKNPFAESIRTDRWKYIRYFVPRPEDLAGGKGRKYDPVLDLSGRVPDYEHLFDLDADPGEEHNLAEDPKHTAVLADMRERCVRQSDALVRQAVMAAGGR